MVITVQQNVFSFRSEYEIETPGAIYRAQKKLFSLRKIIRLFAPREHLLATVRGYFWSFRSKCSFELAGGKNYHFWCKRIWKRVFVCEGENDTYFLYQHKGLNFSVFQNETQIAAFRRNRLKIGASDRYEILVNDDANILVVVCMALAIDDSDRNEDTFLLRYDFGYIGTEERKFDRSWEPS
jgi:uncharacterized protein YxjI